MHHYPVPTVDPNGPNRPTVMVSDGQQSVKHPAISFCQLTSMGLGGIMQSVIEMDRSWPELRVRLSDPNCLEQKVIDKTVEIKNELADRLIVSEMMVDRLCSQLAASESCPYHTEEGCPRPRGEREDGFDNTGMCFKHSRRSRFGAECWRLWAAGEKQ